MNVDPYTSSEDMEFMAMAMMVPFYFIYTFFSYGHEGE